MNEPWWIDLIKAAVIINVLLGMFAYLTWVERKVLGRMQLRYGPNRAGPYGLLQPIADLVKLIRKESFYPATAVDFLYITAPIVSAFTALPPSQSSRGARAGTSPATTSRARWPTSRSR